ncbi:MAG TPA: hypothetical protein VG253_01960 [Streptosporangiaceae bacterium]|jgi:hypothetical protein|nr:hypothetical protein [Streptosporangiaceae bacterium]
MKRQRTLFQMLLACALGVSVAACGSSSTSSAPKNSASASSSSSSAPAGSSTQAQIKTNWVAFFNPKTPVTKRVSLLQNGQAFAPVIRAQAGSSLASSASATVSKVTLVSANQAKVTYSIVVGGAPALSNQSGVAVLQNGTWKVGLASFCGLLTLENSGKTPTTCKSAG